MIVEDHAIATTQVTGLAPVGFHSSLGEARDSLHAMIFRQLQFEAVRRPDPHDGFDTGFEEPFSSRTPRHAVDDGIERRTAKFADPLWP